MSIVSSISPWLSCYHPRPDAKVRLFCFPHGGGGPQSYRDLSQHISQDIEVFSVNLPGRASRFQEPLVRDMETATQAIIQAIASHQDKPFAFFGHSVGAILAYETARKLALRNIGTPIALFVSAHVPPHHIQHKPTMHTAQDAALILLIKQLGLVPEQGLDDPELLQLLLPPMQADFELAEKYRCPKNARLPITIMALGGQDDSLVSPEELDQWQQYTSGTFTKRIYPGGHFYLHTQQMAFLQDLSAAIGLALTQLPQSVVQGPRSDYPLTTCLHDLFSAQAAKTPEALALFDASGQMSFAELDAATDVLARYLQAQGVCVDSISGIYMNTCMEYVVAYLAILKAGGAYMPLEIAYPPDLLKRVIDAARPVTVLSNTSWAHNLPADYRNSGQVFVLQAGWLKDLKTLDLPQTLNRWEGQLNADSLAYCVMSSGTTGTPKGIICPHRGAVNSYFWRYKYYPYGPEEREACNIFFVWEILRPLLQGRPAYIIPNDIIYDPRQLVSFLAQHRINRVLFTPSLLQQILNTPDLDFANTLQELQIVYVNGEVVTTELVRQFSALLPKVTLINDYSISECHDVCTWALNGLDLENLSTKFAPVGPTMDNVALYILDAQLKPVPWGTSGEIYVSGPTLARGYLHQPEKTAERFPPDSVRQDGSVMYRTGDLGRFLPNGHLEVQGRVDFMVKLRGYSVVLGAVETALSEHPQVKSAVVVAENSPQSGQPDYLVAYIVPKQQEALVHADSLKKVLRNHAKEKLPHYAVPALFICIASLPLHAVTGKLDRRQLPRPEEAVRCTSQEAGQMLPKSTLEQQIATIWAEVLHIQPQSVADNFFDLGGHSLLAIQMIHKVAATLQTPLSVVDVFHHPTLQAFAKHIAAKQNQKEDALSRCLDAIITGTKTRRERNKKTDNQEIAIIGMACRFPGAHDLEQFWDNLCQGKRAIQALSEKFLLAQGIPQDILQQKNYKRYGAFIDAPDLFDPAFWGISPGEACLMDPQQRLFLECCWHGLEHAGYSPKHIQNPVGIFAGCFLPSYLLNVLAGGGLCNPADPAAFHLTEIGNDKDYLSSKTAYHLGLTGPAISIQTSCSTALVAVATACQSLRSGQCYAALAGASSLTFPQAGYSYVEGFINSQDGHVRTFDAQASGTVLGDGLGVVVLKRLQDAQHDGDTIYAVIKGYGINNDGNDKAGYSAPSVRGQASVVAQALADAQVHPESIGYIEAHGTGTLIGDPIEVQALSAVFRKWTAAINFCALGSVKPNIGHANIAAGMAGLIKTILCLHRQHIPPSIDMETPNPEMHLEASPFFINTRLTPWPAKQDIPRRAGVSCFGIGGTNAHLVLEEAHVPKQKLQTAATRPQLLVLSAKTATSLNLAKEQLLRYLTKQPTVNCADMAYTLQTGRHVFTKRLAVVCTDRQSAIAALKNWQAPASLTTAQDAGIVFMFPGQGSQYPGMGQQLYASNPDFKKHVTTCCALLAPLMQEDLQKILFPKNGKKTSEAVLLKAGVLQPALFLIEYALAQTLMDLGIKPTALIGHSIGEYVAACLAGVLSLKDALRLVVTRAHAIAKAPEGAMLAVRISQKEAEDVVEHQPGIFLAAINSSHNMVFSGSPQAITLLHEKLGQQGLRCRAVHVNKAFHSPLLCEVAPLLDAAAANIALAAPSIPTLSNLHGGFLSDAEACSPSYWGRQLCGTVRFHENMQQLMQLKPAIFVEIGPGRILSTLAQGISSQQPGVQPSIIPTLPHPLEQEHNDAAFFAQALAQLWQQGLDLHWEKIQAPQKALRIALPGYCFERIRCWPGHAARLTADKQDAIKTAPLTTHNGPTKTPQTRKLCFALPSWARSLVQTGTNTQHSQERWWILLGTSGLSEALGEQLCDTLTQQGQEVLRIRPQTGAAPSWTGERSEFAIDPEQAFSYHQLVSHLAERGRAPHRLIYLWSLTEEEDASMALCQYYRWLHLAQALIERLPGTKPLKIWTISSHILQVDQEAIVPEKATLLGPILTLPQENPHISSRLIDIAPLPSTAADSKQLRLLTAAIVRECAEPDQEPLIALRGPHRWVQRFEDLDIAKAPAARPVVVPSAQTYIITGGLGRIGLTLAHALAKQQARLVLVSRQTLPPQEDWAHTVQSQVTEPKLRGILQQLMAMEAQGSQVLLCQADMGNTIEVKAMLHQAQQHFGTIHGIFHAAGTANLRYIDQMTDAIVEQEFIPKVQGLRHLEEAILDWHKLGHHAPQFVVLFSSMASILGGYGMAAYAGANRFLDAFAQSAACQTDTRWIAINWDDWDFQYGKEQIAAYDKHAAQYALAPEDGIEALQQILRSLHSPQILVTTRPVQPRLVQWLAQGKHDQGSCRNLIQESGPMTLPELPPPTCHAQSLRQTSTIEPPKLEQLKKQISTVYQDVLGLSDCPPEADFFALGGDSLSAARILMGIRQHVAGAEQLKLTAIFACPTVAGLTDHLFRMLASEH